MTDGYKGKNLNMFGNPIHQPTKKYKEVRRIKNR